MRAAPLAAALVVAASAHASPLAWNAPASCPARGEVQAQIEQRLGTPLDQLERQVTVDISREGAAYVARVALDSPNGHELRTLSADNCGELADAVTLIVARLARVRPIAMPSPPVPVAVAAVEVEPAGSIESSAPTALRASWILGARVAALAGAGVLPHASIGGEIAALIGGGSTLFELGYTKWRESRGGASTQMIGGVIVELSTVEVRAGRRVGTLPLRVHAGGDVAVMRGTGIGALGTTATAPWFGLDAGAQVYWQAASWLRVTGGADAGVAVARVRFHTVEGQDIYKSGLLSGRVAVGMEMVWP